MVLSNVKLVAAAAVLACSGPWAAKSPRIAYRLPVELHKASKTGSGSPPQILYHNGNIMLGTVNLYVIYYGEETGFPSTSKDVIESFLGGLSPQPQYSVNTSYCKSNITNCQQGDPNTISGSTHFVTVFNDTGSQGSSINSNTVPAIIAHALNPNTSGSLPVDAKGLYIVIPSPTVKVAGFCTSYCAFHTSSTTIVSGKTIRYAFAPEPDSKCTSCDGNFAIYHQSTTPNGDPGADEVVDSLMHEISESVTDPDISAWYTQSGEEDGDLCNYNYGTAPPYTSNGATANAFWNGHYYLVQLIWKNTAPPQACAPQ